MILIYTCRTSDAKTITAVLPFLPYSMQCCVTRRLIFYLISLFLYFHSTNQFLFQIFLKKYSQTPFRIFFFVEFCINYHKKTLNLIHIIFRSALPMKLIADMICKAGATRVVSLDLYRKEIQGFFKVPVENLRASPFLQHYIRCNIPDYKNAVIVAKNPKAMHKASSYAERLSVSIAVIHGETKENIAIENEPYSPPLDKPEIQNDTGISLTYEMLPVQTVKMKPPLTVTGDVGGKIAIIVDDIIDEAQSFVAAARLLKQEGAYKIYVIVTHGLLSADAPELLENSVIDRVIVTNTVPHEMQKLRCHKIETVDISLLISDAIRRIYNDESLTQLYRNSNLTN
uniref:Pribosyltran_N domain-containing protein n=1 Tax=Elaeophora elaphi TaxID=1147741 RepID=A0A0R3RZV7_9BILA